MANPIFNELLASGKLPMMPGQGQLDTSDPAIAQIMELLSNLEMSPTPAPPTPDKVSVLSRILGPIGDALMAKASVKAGGVPQPGMFARNMETRRRRIGELQQDYQRRLEETAAADRNLRNTLRIGAYQGNVGFKRDVALKEMDYANRVTSNTTKDYEMLGPDGNMHLWRQVIGKAGENIGDAQDLGITKLKEQMEKTKAAEKPSIRDVGGNQAFVYPPSEEYPAGRVVPMLDTNGKPIPSKVEKVKYLDVKTRDSLQNYKTGYDFAVEALRFFEQETGGTAGGPETALIPTAMLPKSTKQYNTLRVKAQAELRKYMLGSAVTPNEMIALEPLISGLDGTPEEQRNSLKGIADFFGRKRQTVLESLALTGIDPDVIEEAKQTFSSSVTLESVLNATGLNTSQETEEETEDEKIERLLKAMGL